MTANTAVQQLEVTALRRQVDRLTVELATELRRNKELRQLASTQADLLQIAQRDNEAAYREAYQAQGGPHFCAGKPFGSQLPGPVSQDDVAHWVDSHIHTERDPARRAAWRMIRDASWGDQ